MLNILTITLVTAVLALVTTNPGGEITAQILLSMAGMLLAQLAFFDMAFLVSALTQDARAALGISVLGVVLAYGFAVTVEYIGSIDILVPLLCPPPMPSRDESTRCWSWPASSSRSAPPFWHRDDGKSETSTPEEQPHHPSSTPRRSHVGSARACPGCATAARSRAPGGRRSAHQRDYDPREPDSGVPRQLLAVGLSSPDQEGGGERHASGGEAERGVERTAVHDGQHAQGKRDHP